MTDTKGWVKEGDWYYKRLFVNGAEMSSAIVWPHMGKWKCQYPDAVVQMVGHGSFLIFDQVTQQNSKAAMSYVDKKISKLTKKGLTCA